MFTTSDVHTVGLQFTYVDLDALQRYSVAYSREPKERQETIHIALRDHIIGWPIDMVGEKKNSFLRDPCLRNTTKQSSPQGG